jgi:DNA-binding transcriptional LysR family regulator
MEWRHLRYFMAAGEEGHFGRAAERLKISQPAMSRQIQDLEAEIGVPLFERLPRGVRLSEAGHAFLQSVRQIAVELDQACEYARRVGRGEVGRLRVGFNEFTIGYAIVPTSFKTFRFTAPDVRLELVAMSSQRQLEALRTGAIDAGFLYHFQSKDDASFEHYDIEVEDIELIVPANHRLARTARISLADLKDEAFIGIRRAAMPDHCDHLMAACHAGGLTPRIVQETHNEATLARLVSVEMGLGLVRSSLRWQLPDNVVMRRVPGLSMNIQFGLVWRRDDRSVILRRFADLVRSLPKSLAKPAPARKRAAGE